MMHNVKALTFDLFGTVLDLAGSLTPHIAEYLATQDSSISPGEFWQQWRQRQRIEQYQDNIVLMGHSGYQTVARRACIYTLKRNGLAAEKAGVDRLMSAWQLLSPFPEVVSALQRLHRRYRLVALSNGEPDFLEHLAENRIEWNFDEIISVQVVGAFKPHPGVYRRAAGLLRLPLSECLMVSANSFDVMGARMCGYRGAYVNREGLPFEETDYLPDLTVPDFTQLADVLLENTVDG